MNSVQFTFCSEPEHRGWSWLCFSHKAVATKARTTLGVCDSSMAALAKADFRKAVAQVLRPWRAHFLPPKSTVEKSALI